MQIEYAFRVLALDDTLQAEVQKLEAEGYSMVPGVVPVALYQLFRPVMSQPGIPQQTNAGPAVADATHAPHQGDTFGVTHKLNIDESKIAVLRADGTLEKLKT